MCYMNCKHENRDGDCKLPPERRRIICPDLREKEEDDDDEEIDS